MTSGYPDTVVVVQLMTEMTVEEILKAIEGATADLALLNNQMAVDDEMRRQGVTRNAPRPVEDMGLVLRVTKGGPFNQDGTGPWKVIAVGSLDGYMLESPAGERRIVKRANTMMLQSDSMGR